MHTVPEWVIDAVFYQIFPDRFRHGSEPWRGDPNQPADRTACGADLAGILDALPYLEDLGINALYLTPIFHAGSYHKYDTIDYKAIDPAFGTNEQFGELVASLHDRGMRIVLDGVFNHCSDRHPFFLDVMARGKKSDNWDWFTIDGDAVRTDPPNYVRWAGVASMPEWNHRNPKVRAYLLDVVRYWIQAFDIDGWRLDTVEYLPPDFVREIREASKEVRSDAYVLGEVMSLGTPWFKLDAVDGVMHYKLWEALVAFLGHETWDAKVFSFSLYGTWFSYPEAANYASYTLISSHDKPRFLTQCGGDIRRLCLAAAFQFTYPGPPAVYYGDEVGLEGGEDPDNRRCFPWDSDTWNETVHSTFRSLIGLRRRETALRRGRVIPLQAEGRTIVYAREHEGERILVALNADHDQPAHVDLTDGPWTDAFEGTPVEGQSIEVPALAYRILKRVPV